MKMITRTIIKAFPTILLMLGSALCFAQTDFRNISLDEALSAARMENKLVFLDVYTDWCGPCKRMLKEIFPLEQTGEYMNSHFVCVKLNAEKEGATQLVDFNINHYPTFIIMDVDRQVVGKYEGGFSDANKFLNMVESLINPVLSPEMMEKRYISGDRDPRMIATYAYQLITEGRNRSNPDSAMVDKGIKMINDYFVSLSNEDRIKKNNLFLYDPLYMSDAFDPKIEFVNGNKIMLEGEPLYERWIQAVSNFYEIRIKDFLSWKPSFTKEEYEKLKNDVCKYGYNKDGKYDNAFLMIEAFLSHDKSGYVDFCDRYIWQLSETERRCILSNLHLVLGRDPVALKKGASFLRNLFLTAPVDTIIYCLRPLSEIEKML